jgi:DNA-binding PadR family transcriptional regulator
VSVPTAILGLLEAGPAHGYDLKQRYDRWFGGTRPLKFGQVYATLSRLDRDGLARVEALEHAEGPERKRYGITPDGVVDLDRRLREILMPSEASRDELFMKVVLAVTSGRDAHGLLDRQRATHLARMRELTKVKRGGDLLDTIAADRDLFHLEADLRWIDLTAARLDRLRKELNDDERA